MKFKPRSKFPHAVATYIGTDLLGEIDNFCNSHACSRSEAIRQLIQNGLAAILLDEA